MSERQENESRSRLLWLIYVALILSGLILIADAFNIGFAARLTARLGVGLLFSAFALIIGKNRPAGIVATAII